MSRYLTACVAIATACSGGDDLGDDPGPYSGPTPELPWPQPCRTDTDLDRDGTLDGTGYFVLDESGHIVEGYGYRDGARVSESRSEYDGRRLLSYESASTENDEWRREEYDWDGNRVVRLTANDQDGSAGVTTWDYDDLGRPILREHRGNGSTIRLTWEYLDADACPDASALRIGDYTSRSTYVNRADCQRISGDQDDDGDGVPDQGYDSEFDPLGHLLMTHWWAVLDDTVVAAYDEVSTWDGDRRLTYELVKLDERVLNVEVGIEYAYDCPDGIPPP